MTTATVPPGAPAARPAEIPSARPEGHPVVRAARPGEEAALSRVLAAAFQDDPLTRWAFPDATYRARVLPAFFRVYVDQCLAHRGVLTTEDLDAALLFLPPGVWEHPDHHGQDAARALDEAVDAAAHPQSVLRLAAITRLQARRHPRHRPHYYLAFIGVRPERRHDLTAAALLRTLLAEVDAAGQAAYAETSSPGGAHLCARNGFTRFGDALALPAGGPQLTPVWRGPR
ncbi:hypothetical protein ACFYUY_24490 [Kitasatospora sp. NPDC004745]|uniref:hypothetical protein n=1 Tax=unclassified Kitasatospora TaxID=2633591 RepID=UPI0033E20B1D